MCSIVQTETRKNDSCHTIAGKLVFSYLKNAFSRKNDTTPVIKKSSQLFFKLSAFKSQLRQYVLSASMPAHVYQLCMDILDDELPDICISHKSDWGIKCELDGYEDQVLYVWFEMAFGYLWAAKDYNKSDADKYILERAHRVYNGEVDIIHCYGFDNAFYHALLFPAIYFALNLKAPTKHIVNELLDLDGQKFSTSRRHLIWGADFVKAARVGSRPIITYIV